jgi:hypothetical protein
MQRGKRLTGRREFDPRAGPTYLRDDLRAGAASVVGFEAAVRAGGASAWERHGLPSTGLARPCRKRAYGRLGQGFNPGLYADSGIWNRSGPFRTKVVVQTTCPVPIARTGLKGTSMNVSPAATVFGVQPFA